MTRSMPKRPSLENLKKQAKTLLKSHSSRDASVCALLRQLHRFARLSDEQILDSSLTLAEAQYALAMDYGFASWAALKEAVEGREHERRFMHLHCGDSSAETLRRSGVPGTVLTWYDPLTEGPVRADVSEDEWFALRASVVVDRFDSLESGIAFFREMYRRLEDYRQYEEVVLWFDACLFDQTILIRHLDWFSRQDMGDTKLSLICIGEFPGLARFRGLGELSPQQMASLLPQRHEVTRREMELARAAWDAYRSPDPRAIEALLAKDTSALPYLAPAMRRHLQRFPSVRHGLHYRAWRNGLGRAEQAALDVIAQGHTEFSDLFWNVSDMEETPYFGDTMLLDELMEMTEGERPLLAVEGLESAEGLPRHEWPLKKIRFSLTEAGRMVREGRADAVRLRGIDKWLGGVHLQGRESNWRWDEEAGKLVIA